MAGGVGDGPQSERSRVTASDQNSERVIEPQGIEQHPTTLGIQLTHTLKHSPARRLSAVWDRAPGLLVRPCRNRLMKNCRQCGPGVLDIYVDVPGHQCAIADQC